MDAPPAPAVPAGSGGRRRRRRHVSVHGAVNVVTVLVLLYLVAGPILMLLLSSFEDTRGGVTIRPPFPWTTANFTGVLGDAQTYRVLGTTIVFSGASLLFAFIVSLVFAWLVERTDLPARGLVYVLLVAPTGMPGLISAIAWGLLLNPTNGYVNVALHSMLNLHGHGPLNAYSLPAMIFVQGLALVPLTFLLITASMRNMSASLEDAGRTSGAGPLTVLRKISLPLLRPVLIGAGIYQFVTVVEAVDVPLVLGLPGHVTVFSTQVYRVTHPAFGLPDYGASSTYGIMLLTLAVVPLLVYNRTVRRAQDFATVTGKAFRPRRQRLGRWRWVAFGASMLYAAVSFVLPMLVLVYASLEPYIGTLSVSSLQHMTLDGYRKTLSTDLFAASLWHTLVVGFAASFAAMLLSVLLSWIIVRSKSRFSWMADVLAFIPHAIPGVVIGLAVLLIYLLLPLPLYGTVWIIVVAMATQYISLGTRLTTGGITQIQQGLEEAARASGARASQVWRHVLLPLLRPVLLNGFLLVFLATIKNLTLPLMLQSSDNVVMSTLIWDRWDYGDVTGAAVLSVILTAVTVTAAIVLRRLSGSGEEL